MLPEITAKGARGLTTKPPGAGNADSAVVERRRSASADRAAAALRVELAEAHARLEHVVDLERLERRCVLLGERGHGPGARGAGLGAEAGHKLSSVRFQKGHDAQRFSVQQWDTQCKINNDLSTKVFHLLFYN